MIYSLCDLKKNKSYYLILSAAGGFGDPHITTLDNRQYTFNGHGEYILLHIESEDIQIQSRTAQAVKTDGTLSEATIFSAFVLQTADSWLQVEINSNKSGINLFAGTNNTLWADYTLDFYENEGETVQVNEDLSFSRDNTTLATIFSEKGNFSDVILSVKLVHKYSCLISNNINVYKTMSYKTFQKEIKKYEMCCINFNLAVYPLNTNTAYPIFIVHNQNKTF